MLSWTVAMIRRSGYVISMVEHSFTRDPKTDHQIARFQEATARNPRDAYACLEMGLWWHWKERYADAFDLYSDAVRFDPDFAYALNARAGLLATCPENDVRDGALAVQDALRAFAAAEKIGELKQDWKHRLYLQGLAAAYAEIGDFDKAIRHQDAALEMAITNNSRAEILGRRRQYELRQPLRAVQGIVRIGFRSR